MAKSTRARTAKQTEAKQNTDRQTTVARSSEVIKGISEKRLKALMGAARTTQQNVQSITGTFGEQVKNAVDKHNLHRKAFRVVCQIDRLEPVKLREFRDMLLYYLDISGIDDRANAVEMMDLGEPETESDASEYDDDGNVVHGDFPHPSGLAAE